MDEVDALRMREAFPMALRDDVDALVGLIPPARHRMTEDIGPITIGGELVRIPYRIYHDVPTVGRVYLPRQHRALLNCLYTRHHDGYVREHHLDALIPVSEPWVAPFIIQLAGEYVVEITEHLLTRVDELSSQVYGSFITENPEFCGKTVQRILSYWICYYRARFPRLPDYPGYRLGRALGLWASNPSAGRRLTRRWS